MSLGFLSWILAVTVGVYLTYVVFRHIGRKIGVRSEYLGFFTLPYNIFRIREITRTEYLFSVAYNVAVMVLAVLLLKIQTSFYEYLNRLAS